MRRKLLIPRRSLLAAPAILLLPRKLYAAKQGTVLADGFSGAPVGTPQHSTLLNGYVKRAPWHVAGVDYAVGVPSNVTPVDPTTGDGVTTNATIRTQGAGNTVSGGAITFTGNGLTITGWDFTQHNGITIVCSNLTNSTIQNCTFKATASNLNDLIVISSNCSNVIIQNNIFDGGSGAAESGSSAPDILLSSNCTGVFTVKYNWFKNNNWDCIQAGENPAIPGCTYNIMYNIFERGMWDVLSHADNVQLNIINGTANILFNLMLQPATDVGTGAPGTPGSMQSGFCRIETDPSNGGSHTYYPVIAYNTGIWTGGLNHLHDIGSGTPGYDGTAVNAIFDFQPTDGFIYGTLMHNNYLDPSSKISVLTIDPAVPAHPHTMGYLQYSNWDMTTGSLLSF